MDTRTYAFIAALLSFASLCLAYSNHFHNSFHFDDFHVLVNNAYIQDLQHIKAYFTDTNTASSLPSNQLYRPMFTLSLAIDYWLGHELAPFWFHVSTFVWYVFLCMLLYGFYLKLAELSTPSPWHKTFAWLAATWFGLHTAHAETINYISARSDSISTFWLMMAFMLFIYKPSTRRYGLYLLPLLIGLLFKQAVIVFPGLLFLYILFFEEQAGLFDFKAIINALRATLPALITCVLMCVFLIKMLPASADTGGGPFPQYLMTQPYVVFHYFKTFFLPTTLTADSDFALLTHISDWHFLFGMTFLLSLVLVIMFTAKTTKTRPIAFGLGWFLIALLPTSLVPLAEVMNDHRIFFPYIGLLLAVSYSLYLLILNFSEQLQKERGICIVFIAGLLAAHGYGTYQRNQVWHTEDSLWQDVTIKSPKNGRGLMNYGLTHMAAGRYDEAETYFMRSLALNPNYSVLHTNLAILKNVQGKPKLAEHHFKQALKFGPNDPSALYFYASHLNQQGHSQQARPLLKRLVEISPAHTDAKNALADTYLNLSFQAYLAKNYPLCIEHAADAIKYKPKFAAAYNNLCSGHVALKQFAEAEAACLKALEIDPNYDLAKNNLMDIRQQKR